MALTRPSAATAPILCYLIVFKIGFKAWQIARARQRGAGLSAGFTRECRARVMPFFARDNAMNSNGVFWWLATRTVDASRPIFERRWFFGRFLVRMRRLPAAAAQEAHVMTYTTRALLVSLALLLLLWSRPTQSVSDFGDEFATTSLGGEVAGSVRTILAPPTLLLVVAGLTAVGAGARIRRRRTRRRPVILSVGPGGCQRPADMHLGLRGLCLLALLVPALSIPPARASHIVDAFGLGSITARVWCAKTVFPPPGPATHGPVTSIGLNVALFLGPLLPGCSPITEASGTNGPFWSMTTLSRAGPFDVARDDATDLFDLIVPVSPLAVTALSVFGEIINANQARFFIDWFGSDAGTAQRLQWFEGTTLLDEELRVGPWNESSANGNPLEVLITSVGDIESVILVNDNIAAAVPEPSFLVLFGIGALGLVTYKGARRKRVWGRTQAEASRA